MTIRTERTPDQLLASLAWPRRRELVRCLVEKPRSIADLSTTLDLGDSAVFENLRVLSECNLVRSSREEGRTRNYLVRDGLAPLIYWLRTCGFEDNATLSDTAHNGAWDYRKEPKGHQTQTVPGITIVRCDTPTTRCSGVGNND